MTGYGFINYFGGTNKEMNQITVWESRVYTTLELGYGFYNFDEALILDDEYSINWEFNPDLSYGVTLDLYKDGERLGKISSQPSYFVKSHRWDMTYYTEDYANKVKPEEGNNYQIYIYTAKSDDEYPIETFSDNFSIASYDYDSVSYPGYSLSLQTNIPGVVYLRMTSLGILSEPYYVDVYGVKNIIGGVREEFLIKSDIKITGQNVLPVNLEDFGVIDNQKYEYSFLVCSSFDGCVMGSTNSIAMNIEQSDDDEDDDNSGIEKIIICHRTGNGNGNTLEIAESAWPAHQTHGDALGACTDTDNQNKRQANIQLTNRLKGRILLQVENHGEAWYVRPDNGNRIYMKDGDTAYGMMRDFGLGISNADLEKIPIGVEDRFECIDNDNDGLCNKLEEGLGTDPNDTDSDDDGFDDGAEVKSAYNPLGVGKSAYNSSLVNNVKGKIVLQVQSRGEAWYINPDDGKRYYMTDGEAAYQIMRYLSLGITNNDLEQISTE